MYIARKVEYDMTSVPVVGVAIAGYATDVAFRRLYGNRSTMLDARSWTLNFIHLNIHFIALFIGI